MQRDLSVSYKTAWYMAMRIRRAMIDQKKMLMGIIEVGETYVSGKPRKFNNKKPIKKYKRGRGTDKIPVVGLVEHGEGGNVYAEIKRKLASRDLNELVRKKVNSEYSVMITLATSR